MLLEYDIFFCFCIEVLRFMLFSKSIENGWLSGRINKWEFLLSGTVARLHLPP